MSNINVQLNDGPHGAWAGDCRTSSGENVYKNCIRVSRDVVAPPFILLYYSAAFITPRVLHFSAFHL